MFWCRPTRPDERFPESADKSEVAAYRVGSSAFWYTLLSGRFRLLFVMHTRRLLETLPAKFACAQEAAVELNGHGFTGLLAPRTFG